VIIQRPVTISPSIDQYIQLAEALRSDPEADFRSYLKIESDVPSLSHALERDENSFRLRKDVLTRPRLLQEAAVELWPNATRAQAKEGLQALLEIIAKAKSDQAHEDLCPTRLHYFIKTQDGFYVCLNKKCPAKKSGKPMFYVSRRNEVNGELLTEDCPDCHQSKMKSKLVEVVSCRKCGYFYGALQDLGPRHAQVFKEGSDDPRPAFDSFTTELGWAADSFWSYFSVEEDLPYPSESKSDKEDEDDLIAKPEKIAWCVSCGRKRGKGLGMLCVCESPELREIEIFHRQCPSDKADNLYENRKKLLASCPNCGARNTSGIEPVKRFQESDDEMGLAMAIPFAHFQVSRPLDGKNPRKLLCFTDHRQRAAAFPSLLEEETFIYDIGRKIIQFVKGSPRKALTFVDLGIQLYESTLDTSSSYDPDFFLPVSRHPEGLDPRSKDVILRNLWVSEIFGYFSIPDAARESAEDFGLVAVRFELKEEDKRSFFALLSPFGIKPQEADDILQVLLGFVRQGKALTLPNGVHPDDPAFGSVTTADIYFVYKRDKGRNTRGWMPVRPHNMISDYLQRSLKVNDTKTMEIADQIWTFLIGKGLFAPVPSKLGYKLIHEGLSVVLPMARYRCDRCKLITAYIGTGACPKKKCEGRLSKDESDANTANVITRWLSKVGSPLFYSLTSEEHSAQINKDIAKKIEDEFRAEGVNLLSSTTTFEMGINIGDLQKVLLRNAPPSSANYIQRVGRAGRGIDKNAISVTLCRRTKYDADAWNDPVRLMSGVVRAPSVFINNRVISQRHFNAVVFARFLREELLDGQKLKTLAQQIPIAPFFPSNIRGSIPEKWFPEDTFTVFLDFEKWVSGKPLDSLFSSDPAATIASALGSVDKGRGEMLGKYKEIMEALLSETQALLGEGKKLLDEGLYQQAVSIMDAVKNLLKSDVISLLAKKGFLPRYAFPLDVVALETGLTRWSRDKDVDLSRDRGIAIAEFAPGAQVIAKKKVFTSEGLYVVGKKDEPTPEHFSQCPNCRQIRTGKLVGQLLGPCNVCSKPITRGDVKPFITPIAFSIRIDRKSGGNTTKYRPNTLIRQRQSLIHFIDKVDSSQFRPANNVSLALVENGNLFRYNLGPGDQGFMVCPKCGCSEPMLGLKADHAHQRLRALSGKMTCDWKGLLRHISFGHTFESFCLIVRPLLFCPSLESLAYALQKGLCLSLEIETSDIGVSWRFFQNPDRTMGAEIILYDLAPGGAGFVRDAFQGWDDIMMQTQLFLKGCSCEKACYECLKNYSNQSFHEKLDRKKALQYFT